MNMLDDTAQPRVAVIGAGLAGASCAHELSAAGWDVTVYDKSRGPGGRASTRRRGGVVADHGAQYFTVRTPEFRAVADGWIANGVAQPWDARVVYASRGSVIGPAAESNRYVGVPGMSSLSSNLLRGIAMAPQTRVRSVQQQRDGWALWSDGDTLLGTFNAVFVAIPPNQAVEIADGTSPLVDEVRGVTMVPCWAVVVAFESRIGAPWDAAHITDSALAWVARNPSKPGRPQLPEVWTLHASAEWSIEHMEDDPDSVARQLVQAFEQLAPVAGAFVLHRESHRWRYARPLRSGEPRALFDAMRWIGFCGDWTGHARIESAVLSGMELARVATASLGRNGGETA